MKRVNHEAINETVAKENASKIKNVSETEKTSEVRNLNEKSEDLPVKTAIDSEKENGMNEADNL